MEWEGTQCGLSLKGSEKTWLVEKKKEDVPGQQWYLRADGVFVEGVGAFEFGKIDGRRGGEFPETVADRLEEGKVKLTIA